MLSRVTAKNVGDVFLRHTVVTFLVLSLSFILTKRLIKIYSNVLWLWPVALLSSVASLVLVSLVNPTLRRLRRRRHPVRSSQWYSLPVGHLLTTSWWRHRRTATTCCRRRARRWRHTDRSRRRRQVSSVLASAHLQTQTTDIKVCS